MKLSNWSYLFSIFLFCGPLLLIIWKRQERILKKYEFALLFATLVSMPIGASEFFALKWRAWQYNKDSILPIRVGGQIESYIFLAAVIWLVGSVTLILSVKQDKKLKNTARQGSKQKLRSIKKLLLGRTAHATR